MTNTGDRDAAMGALGRPRLCGYEGCNRPHESRGYCAGHAAQVRAGLALAPILSRSESARRNLQAALALRPRGRTAMTCEGCGQRFERYTSQPKRRFCSRACAYGFMRGPNGAAALSNRKKPYTPPNKGCGDQGRRVEAYRNRTVAGPIDRWRLSVYHRDGFICQRCGDARGRNLQAHHIIGWAQDPALRFELFNGVTLCEACHKRLHASRARCSICGRRSTSRNLCARHYLRWWQYGDPLLTKCRLGGHWTLMRVES
jgi:hypothetical protein